MENFILKGHVCYSEDQNHIRIVPDAYLVCENGRSAGVFTELPERYASLPVEEHGDRLIIPGLTDLHVHAPQFAFRGLGADMELLDWLNTYTFPEESKYSDMHYAQLAYRQFVKELRATATTRLSVFATLHLPATEFLMQELENSGLVSYVGKVNMDRNSPEYLCEKDAATALENTERWICETKSAFAHTKPILTPRFIPSCSDALLRGLGELADKYGLPVQSHLSENLGEIAWVRELCPQAAFYGDAYDRFGLFGGAHPCIMAHCVHSCEEEIERMRKNGVFVAHSPMSNANLASGVAPVSKYLARGLNVGIASDVAGGETLDLFRVMADALRDSKLRWRLLDQEVKPLTFEQVFYMATLGGGRFFGKVGSFEPGYEFDAVVLDDIPLCHPQPLSLHDRLERCIYLSNGHQVYAKYVAGRKVEIY